MATVIDSLFVELGLDASDFMKNSKAVADELKKFRDQNVTVSKSVIDSNKKLGESFAGVKSQVMGLIAAYFGLNAIKTFIQSNVQGQAELGRLSQNLDISARRLEAWGTIAEEMGDKAQTSFSALQTVAAGLAEATIKGSSALTDVARANGISLVDTKGKLVSSEEVLIRFSARMAQLPRQQAIALANMAGIGGLSNELLLGPEALRQRLADAERLSRVTEESTKQAQELQKRWADVQKQIKGIGDNIFAKIEPTLERLTDKFQAWANSIDWDKLANRVEYFIHQLGVTIDDLGGLKTVAIVVGGILAANLLSPLLGIAGALLRIGGLIPGVTAGLGGLGTAAGGFALSATGVAAAGIAAAVYSPALGGAQRPDGSYNDEVARPKGDAPGTDINSLWNAVQGKPSAFLGTREFAARLIAERGYGGDKVSEKSMAGTVADILSGKITDTNTGGLLNIGRQSSQAAPAGSHQAYFRQLESKYNLPAGLLDRIWNKESSRATGAITSSAGAQGPFQIMPTTAADLGLVGNDVNDVDKAAAGAAAHLGRLSTKYNGDLTKVLAAYNWGEGNVDRQGLGNAPAETRDYIKLAQGLQIGPPQAYGGSRAGSTSTSSSEVHIDSININAPNATDSKGIAATIGPALRQNGIVQAANTGVE